MNPNKPTTTTDIRRRIRMLKYVEFEERVVEARRLVNQERRPEIEELEAQLRELQKARPTVSPRIPKDTPPDVVTACENYWKGTEEFWTFRIHLWSKHAIWTSYPAGAYTDNGGRHVTSPMFYMIERCAKQRTLRYLESSPSTRQCRFTTAKMQEALDRYEKKRQTDG